MTPAAEADASVMRDANLDSPRADRLLETLGDLGVTHIVGLPDNMSAALFRRLEDRTSVRLVSVTREGEAFAMAAGLWLGGAVPVVLIQNTGLLESGDALRGTAMRMGVPLLTLITYRGFTKLSGAGGDVGDPMTRADTDSAAVVTEPTLRAWRVPYERYDSDADLPRVRELFEAAQRDDTPVGLLITRALC